MTKKLNEILEYYQSTFQIDESIDDIRKELIDNNVEVNGNSFYCEIYHQDTGLTCLLAGTKDKADMWVLKKIIKLLRSGKQVVSLLNGNSEFILPMLEKYNVKVLSKHNDLVYISFNMEGG